MDRVVIPILEGAVLGLALAAMGTWFWRRRRAAMGSIPAWPALALVTAVFGCSIYANLSHLVKDYRYFPPFDGYNANHTPHLGAEHFHIAQALVGGHGFANPFGDATGPTAWMPPVLPGLLAAILWLCGGDRNTVMAVFVLVQVTAVALTGLLLLGLSRARGAAAWGVVGMFVAAALGDFYLWFQVTHDYFLTLLAIDLVVVGLCCWRPLASRQTAAVWGLAGGLCALVNPIVALAWGVMTGMLAVRERAWRSLVLAGLCAGLTLLPWTVRNYLVFGRWMPVKSNLAYELWQSQCLQPEDGLLHRETMMLHPYSSNGLERQEYNRLGEIPFLDRKSELFWAAFADDPEAFVNRAAGRFIGATLWYVPYSRDHERRRPWTTWASRLIHPLPFLSMLLLVYSAFFMPLSRAQWAVIGVYALYLLPYIAISYYERYAIPLLGVKVLLVVWGAERLRTLTLVRFISADHTSSYASSCSSLAHPLRDRSMKT